MADERILNALAGTVFMSLVGTCEQYGLKPADLLLVLTMAIGKAAACCKTDDDLTGAKVIAVIHRSVDQLVPSIIADVEGAMSGRAAAH